MFRNNNPEWIPIFSCMFLFSVGLVVSLCLILSLFPLYLNNHSVPKSNTIYPVYTLSQLSFTIGSSTTRQVRDASSSSYLPSEKMTASIQQQLNHLLSEINAVVVVSQATMSSTSKLSLILKLYFLEGCFACKSRERRLINRIFKKNQSINIYTEYYTSCVLDPITVGTIPIILDDDISNSYGISSPIQTSINSLVKQSDPCPNRTALIYPTDCNATEASGAVTSILVNNGALQYYCYYFVTPASASNIQLQFVFSSTIFNVYTILDDVTLNSTENLIINGDFGIYSTTPSGYPYQWSSWTSSECQSCLATPANGNGATGFYGFLASGVGITLSQTVAINTVGRQFVYRLGFWFQCAVADDDPTESCSLLVKLVTT